MSTVSEVHVHRDPPNVVGSRERLGVSLLIFADIAFVACMIFSYFYLRFLNVNGQWLPDDVTPAGAVQIWIINGILIVGMLVFAWGARALRSGKASVLTWTSLIATLAAAAAAVLQYQQFGVFNFPRVDSGYFSSAYSSSMVALAGANLFQICLTVFISLGIANRSRMGRYDSPSSWQPRIATYWWIWVAVSAVLVGLMTTFFINTPFPASM